MHILCINVCSLYFECSNACFLELMHVLYTLNVIMHVLYIDARSLYFKCNNACSLC